MNIKDILAKSFQIYMLLGGIYSTGPLMVPLSKKMSKSKLSKFIFTEVIMACSLALFFANVGSPALQSAGVTLPAIKLTGGILLLFAGMELTGVRKSAEPMIDCSKDMFLIPIAFPMLAGPATLFTIGCFPRDELLCTNISVIAACIGTYLTLRLLLCKIEILSDKVVTITTKLSGVFVVSLACQMILSGFWTFKS